MRNDRHWVPGKDFFILLFYIDFFSLSFSALTFLKKFHPAVIA